MFGALFRLDAVSRQRADHSKAEQELRNLKAQCDSSAAEMKKVTKQKNCFLCINIYTVSVCITTYFN